MEKSTVKLVSNIMLKSKFEKDKYSYIPFDILPSSYKDKRSQNMLTKQQSLQDTKRLFWAKKIIEIEENN